MELDKLHVLDRGPGAIRHRETVASRDIGIGRIKIDFAATAGREQCDRRGERINFAGILGEHVCANATIYARDAELAGGDQVDSEVILENFDVRLRRD